MSKHLKWLGSVSPAWRILRLAQVTNKITNGYVGPTRELFVDTGVVYLQSLHIKENHIRFSPTYFVTEKWSKAHSKSILKTGDVLVVQTGDIGQVAIVPPEYEGANCHALIILGCRDDMILGVFLSWVLNSNYGFHALKSIQTGALHPHLNCTLVRDVPVPIPSLAEQRAIADFLDRKTQAIDALIQKKERLIALLQEKRQALITQAVTKGLDPTVPMKDSGIEWLGDIPAHWDLYKLGYVAFLLNGFAFDSTTYVQDGIPIIRIGDVSDDINWEEVKRVPHELAKILSRSAIRRGDILLAMTGATIGKTAFFDSDQPALLNQRVGVIRGTKIMQAFLAFFVQSEPFVRSIDYQCYGGAQANIGKGEISSIVVPLPPKDEQPEIVMHLWVETKRLDDTICLLSRSTKKLREYRQTLISAAVTGKIDVTKETA